MNRDKERAVATNVVPILTTEATNKIGQKIYESIGYSQFDDFYHYVLKINL